ncbi:MAG: outer membrane lipoprotein-sorting protein [Deltaproteobacteria bacterium]|nr:outer membrane lipoprotein-sorting protein [Deltaproteobacteria bacterium]
MKYYRVCMAVFVLSVMFWPLANAEELSAYQIAKKSEDLMNQARDTQAEMSMTLVNKKGDTRQRKLMSYGKNYDNGAQKALIVFESPADVKGTSFLSWSSPDKDEDEQWLYLPALQRVRQISTGGKGESFMGTEFTFYDMGNRNLEDENFTLLKEEEIEGEMCYVIEAVPKEMKYYSKVITWIRKDSSMPLKMDFYDKKGKYLKQSMFSSIQTIKGIRTPTHIEMHNVQNDRKTIIELSNIQYDTGLNDDIFTQRYMKRGK